MNVGRIIYGYCNGFFGRDSYNNKRIEAEGIDWVVARAIDEDASPEFAEFSSTSDKQKYIEDWSKDTSV